MNGLIPLYGSDLDLHDWVSPQRAARLVALDLVQAVRSRTGEIKRLVFRRRPSDATPVHLADYLGTHYSFRERLENGCRCWRLRRLGRGNELRPAFLTVVAECTVSR
jgi:hypothetical protein